MKILDNHQIQQKLRRLAIEILENNYEEEEIIFAGINNNGMAFAKLLGDQLQAISKVKVTHTNLRLNPAKPLSSEIEIGIPVEQLQDKVIIVVDDVANTGRTIFYAIKPLLDTLPKKVEVAVLVDRTHKSFPIRADFVGISLATTLLENIEVKLQKVKKFAVYLK